MCYIIKNTYSCAHERVVSTPCFQQGSSSYPANLVPGKNSCPSKVVNEVVDQLCDECEKLERARRQKAEMTRRGREAIHMAQRMHQAQRTQGECRDLGFQTRVDHTRGTSGLGRMAAKVHHRVARIFRQTEHHHTSRPATAHGDDFTSARIYLTELDESDQCQYPARRYMESTMTSRHQTTGLASDMSLQAGPAPALQQTRQRDWDETQNKRPNTSSGGYTDIFDMYPEAKDGRSCAQSEQRTPSPELAASVGPAGLDQANDISRARETSCRPAIRPYRPEGHASSGKTGQSRGDYTTLGSVTGLHKDPSLHMGRVERPTQKPAVAGRRPPQLKADDDYLEPMPEYTGGPYEPAAPAPAPADAHEEQKFQAWMNSMAKPNISPEQFREETRLGFELSGGKLPAFLAEGPAPAADPQRINRKPISSSDREVSGLPQAKQGAPEPCPVQSSAPRQAEKRAHVVPRTKVVAGPVGFDKYDKTPCKFTPDQRWSFGKGDDLKPLSTGTFN